MTELNSILTARKFLKSSLGEGVPNETKETIEFLCAAECWRFADELAVKDYIERYKTAMNLQNLEFGD